MESQLYAEQTRNRTPFGFGCGLGIARHRRAGLMMTELIVAMILLAICMSILGPGVGWSLKQRKLGWQRQIAQLELQNQLEMLSAIPWEELTTEKLNRLVISTESSLQLPDAVLSGELKDVSDPIESRVVRLKLRWKTFNGTQVRPVDLSTVIHREEGS